MLVRVPRQVWSRWRPATRTAESADEHPAGRRWPRRLLGALGLAVVAAIVSLALLLSLTPSVGDAPQRARRWQTAHGANPPVTDLPPRIVAAVLAVEDHRFNHHFGIDVLALGRAGVGVVTGSDQGGSTIEVQLGKLLYTGGRRDLRAQAEQAALAIKLDWTYSKSQILLMYLNSEYFGHGFYGIAAASHGYFGRGPDQLDWSQAALLAGLLKAPSDYDPLLHPQESLRRRAHVLQRLRAVGALTGSQLAQAESTGLELRP